jgi:hypothetical protein
MHFNTIKNSFSILVCTLSLSTFGQIHNNQNAKHIKVALRMIGHQILLNSHDSISRILPIIEENGNYKIEFSNEFEFEPTKLANTVNRVVEETNLARNYIVEMVKCGTDEVVYSYEIGKLKQLDIIPCGTRKQPRGCYSLLFMPLDILPQAALHEPTVPHSKSSSNLLFKLLGLFVVLSLGIWLWFRKKKPTDNPNMIQLGEFQFDKLNMLLLLKEQKIELTSKETDLLLLLYHAVNQTVEKEVLLRSVWGDEGDYVGRTLDVFISKLRKKLEFDPNLKIVNIRGVGYKLIIG